MRLRFNHNTSALARILNLIKNFRIPSDAAKSLQHAITQRNRVRARCPNRRMRDYADNPRASTHLWKSDSEFSCLNSDFLRVSEFSTKWSPEFLFPALFPYLYESRTSSRKSRVIKTRKEVMHLSQLVRITSPQYFL